MANIYTIRRCSAPNVPLSFAAYDNLPSFQSRNVGDVVKFAGEGNGLDYCYSIIAKTTGQPLSVDRSYFQSFQATPGVSACDACSPPPQTYYVFTVRPCGNPGGATITATSFNVQNLYQGAVAKVGGTCYEVLSTGGSQATPGDLDTTNAQVFNSCGDCQLPPPPPPGGGGGGTSNFVYIYKIRRCGSQSSFSIVDGYRETTDLFPGYAVKSASGLCFDVQPQDGYPIQVSINSIPAGATDIRNNSNNTNPAIPNGCTSCTDTPAGGGGGGTGTQQGPGGFQGQSGLGQGDGLGGPGSSGFTGTDTGGQGYNCVSGNCVQTTGLFTYATLTECIESGCAPPGEQQIAGYNCISGNCVATSGPATYSSLSECSAECTPSAVGFTCTLVNCQNPTDIITGWRETLQEPGQIYRFTKANNEECWSCYTLQSITAFFNQSGKIGPALEGKTTYLRCDDCGVGSNCAEAPYDICVEFPDHPTCDPCYNFPCSAGCPLECNKCPGDPRCVTEIDPCIGVIEPTQGDLLNTWNAGPPFNFLPEDSTWDWMIDPCWQHKYCVCRTQPDPINRPYFYEYKVCLCGAPIDNLPNPCPAAGTLIKYECRNTANSSSPIKYEKWGVYTNGSCGTYDQLIENNSVFCGAPTTPGCTPSGTLIRTYCINTDKYGEYHDGKCGQYFERIEVNSKTCGYVDPPPPPPPPPPTFTPEPPSPARVYYPIEIENTLRTIDVSSFALWTNNTPYLLTPSTKSLSSNDSLDYILSVYDKSPDTLPTCSAELQYNIIYADYEGKGATDLGGLDNQTLTKAMYTQYAHVLLPHGQEKFNFNGQDEDYVYIIDIARNRFKQSLDPGNWEITFASSSFSNDNGIDSILTDMYTASYQNSTLTLVDSLTKRDSKEIPVYLSSEPYDVYIGTLEDGIGSNYITSSIASSSLARPGDNSYIVSSTTAATETTIVKGARIYYFYPDGLTNYRIVDGVGTLVEITPPSSLKNVNSGATIQTSYSMSLKESISEYGSTRVLYEGSWTGSFSLPGTATLSPTLISGSCSTYLYYDSSFQLLGTAAEYQTIDGLTFDRNASAIAAAKKQKLTVNSVTYDGVLKWTANGTPATSLFTGSLSYNTSNISGKYTGSATMAFVTDDWGIQTFVEDPVDPNTDFTNYQDIDNGFILVPVKRTSYGRMYPSHGIIVLSGKKLDELGLNTNRSIDNHGYNTYRLYHSVKLVLDNGLTDLSGDALSFYARGVDIKRASRYFITLKNSHLNYSNNPTYISGSEGIIVDAFSKQNKAYFSSIGLYNTEKELLAIGKVSRPIMSSLTDEMLFSVKITQ